MYPLHDRSEGFHPTFPRWPDGRRMVAEKGEQGAGRLTAGGPQGTGWIFL